MKSIESDFDIGIDIDWVGDSNARENIRHHFV